MQVQNNPVQVERHLFISADLVSQCSALNMPPDKAVTIRTFDAHAAHFAGVERSIHAILLCTDTSLQKDSTGIRDWLIHDPERISRLIVIGQPDPGEFSPAIRDNIILLLPKESNCDQLSYNINHVFNLIQLEYDKLNLSSRLALNSSDLHQISEVGQALSTENDFNKLIDLIMTRALDLSNADSGSIYLTETGDGKEPPTHLRFVRSSMQLDANQFLLPIDSNSIAGHVAATNRPLLIRDVHFLPADAKFAFNSDFDEANHYYTKSMMVIPMTNYRREVIGVLQLINRKKNKQMQLSAAEMQGPSVIEFSQKDYELASAIAGQAAVAIDNQRLLNGQKKLLESFIHLIANAIDSKSEYTGGHCKRVPILTEMLAEAACQSQAPGLADFDLNEDEWYELRIAAGLHDCGKIVTSVHVMDKATKLQTIYDRVAEVEARFEILKRDAALRIQRRMHQRPAERTGLESELVQELETLDAERLFIQRMNVGGEMLADSDVERIQSIANRTVQISGRTVALLNPDEVHNLCVRRGTLTEDERLIINAHMVETIKMLEALPFPPNLRRVPEYAGGHHEKMDGKGYPKGLYGADMSIPARIMAIADVFEALTALDRPYKKGKTLSETMQIMGNMKKFNHLDPDLFDLFIQSGVYRQYAAEHLPAELIDPVDEASLLAIQPLQFELPPRDDRTHRKSGFLAEYSSFL
ncbi:MAG: GAF domain-containing protein [Leptospiraceae bacterium]|nr:GAF domain-containing protein [Leptospiraceae bacterium]